LSGGRLYTIQAGTVSTPQNSFQDSALTLPWPNPITLDATGRVPVLWFSDGLIKIRLTSETGVVQLVADNLAVIGSSSGGGGGGTIDPTTIFQTGDLKPRYGTGVHTGWVRGNGRTIGNSLSGATELANDADAVALYTYLWTADSTTLFLTVSGGRGASAAADFAAGKTLTLPDFRGAVIGGLDDMGSSAAGRLHAGFFGDATALGNFGGSQSHTLTIAQLASHLHGGSLSEQSTNHRHDYDKASGSTFNMTAGGTTVLTTLSTVQSGEVTANHSHTFTGTETGSGQAHNNVQPTMLVTIYLKL